VRLHFWRTEYSRKEIGKAGLLFICFGGEHFVTCSLVKGMDMENLWCRNRQDLGKKGEDVALEYLLQRGMQLLERNWRCGHKEIDLIMLEGDCIRFVEVRSREYPSVVDPFESITLPKRRKIISAARGYLAGKGRGLSGGKEAAFDVVSILFNGELFELKYIREAFGPTW